jgi:hypothetical protein
VDDIACSSTPLTHASGVDNACIPLLFSAWFFAGVTSTEHYRVIIAKRRSCRIKFSYADWLSVTQTKRTYSKFSNETTRSVVDRFEKHPVSSAYFGYSS